MTWYGETETKMDREPGGGGIRDIETKLENCILFIFYTIQFTEWKWSSSREWRFTVAHDKNPIPPKRSFSSHPILVYGWKERLHISRSLYDFMSSSEFFFPPACLTAMKREYYTVSIRDAVSVQSIACQSKVNKHLNV